MKPDRDLAAVSMRLLRESAHAAHSERVICETHGIAYACAGAELWESGSGVHGVPFSSCGHIACRRILARECPECPT